MRVGLNYKTTKLKYTIIRLMSNETTCFTDISLTEQGKILNIYVMYEYKINNCFLLHKEFHSLTFIGNIVSNFPDNKPIQI